MVPAAGSGRCEGIVEPVPEADRLYSLPSLFLSFVLDVVRDEDSRKLFDLEKQVRAHANPKLTDAVHNTDAVETQHRFLAIDSALLL